MSLFFALPASAHTVVHCSFARRVASFSGLCHSGPRMLITLAPRSSPEGGAWRTDVKPRAIWAGAMQGRSGKLAPVQLQLFSSAAGVLQTVDGWFPAHNVRVSRASLSFDVAVDREVLPSRVDRQIIDRTLQILFSSAAWNRNDNRACPPNETKYSIYCAGELAVREITRAPFSLINHRRPAMEVIRGVVDDRTRGRNYNHRLMDYNNDPTTTFADVRSLLQRALIAIDDRAWLAAHGFAAK